MIGGLRRRKSCGVIAQNIGHVSVHWKLFTGKLSIGGSSLGDYSLEDSFIRNSSFGTPHWKVSI